MAYTNNDGMDTTKPDGATTPANTIDTLFIGVKQAIKERMTDLFGVDFESSTNQLIGKLAGVATFFGTGKQAVQTVVNLGSITGTVALDFDVRGNYLQASLTGNTTFTMSNARPGTTYVLFLSQDGTGGWNLFWPASVRWPGGVSPTFNTTANRLSVVTLTPYGSVILGSVLGTGFNVS